MIGPFTFDLKGEKGAECAKLKLSARIEEGDTLTDFPENATVGGNCETDMSLTFAGKILKISFDKDDARKIWELKSFSVTSGGNVTVFSDNSTTKYQAPTESSFSCQSRHTMTQDGMVLVVQQLKFQPFMNGANSFGRAESCDADKAANNIVPIAVGAALAVLVIIVLVLYLIGRRKHQKGYQTV